jgi:iron complex transport system substrate-binding protein
LGNLTYEVIVPTPHRPTRRAFLVGATATGLLAACGGDDDTDDGASPGSTATDATTSTGDGSAPPATDTGSAGAGPQTVEADFGPFTLAAAPERVVTGYDTDTDVAIVLGLPLAGAPGARGTADRPFPEYQPAEALEGVTRIATFSPELNLEQVAAARPDLILDGAFGLEERYDDLAAIAPTLSYNGALSDGWRAALRLVGTALGRSAEAETFVADYEERAAAIAARVAADRGGAKVALVYVAGPGTFSVDSLQLNQTHITFTEAGFTLGDAVPETFDEVQQYTLERVDVLADVDVLLLSVDVFYSGAEASTLERDRGPWQELLDSPLWRSIPAVAAGNQFEVPAELIFASPLTAAANLDLIEATLLT